MNIRRNDLARCVVVVVLLIGLGGSAAGQPSGNQPAAIDLWSLAKGKQQCHRFSTLFTAQQVRAHLATVGRTKLHHDVACQIYDWDGDGRNEVVLATAGFLIELDGSTGVERRRFPLPKDATDCLVFANLSGGPRATDVLVKTRYTQIWAFNREGRQLWTVENPGGYPMGRDR